MKIGKRLRESILWPMVYEPLEKGMRKRLLLISILTDGAPSSRDEDLVDVIFQCGNALVAYQRPRDSIVEWVDKWMELDMRLFLASVKKLCPLSLEKKAALVNFPDRDFLTKLHEERYFDGNKRS